MSSIDDDDDPFTPSVFKRSKAVPTQPQPANPPAHPKPAPPPDPYAGLSRYEAIIVKRMDMQERLLQLIAGRLPTLIRLLILLGAGGCFGRTIVVQSIGNAR